MQTCPNVTHILSHDMKVGRKIIYYCKHEEKDWAQNLVLQDTSM